MAGDGVRRGPDPVPVLRCAALAGSGAVVACGVLVVVVRWSIRAHLVASIGRRNTSMIPSLRRIVVLRLPIVEILQSYAVVG